MNERRVERSDVPEHAARLYLERLRRRGGLRSLALADSYGDLVAGAGAGQLRAFAAVAPMAHEQPADAHDGLLGLMTGGRPLRVQGFELGGTWHYLAAVGGAPPEGAQPALSRILA